MGNPRLLLPTSFIMVSLAILASKVMSTHRMVLDRVHTVMTFPCGSYIECKFHKFHGDVQYCCGTAEEWCYGDYVDTFLFCNQDEGGCVICRDDWVWDDRPVCPCGQHV